MMYALQLSEGVCLSERPCCGLVRNKEEVKLTLESTTNYTFAPTLTAVGYAKSALSKRAKNEGSEREDVIGYYRNPQDAFKALLGHKIRTEDANTLNQLVDAVTSHNAFIEAWVTDNREIRK